MFLIILHIIFSNPVNFHAVIYGSKGKYMSKCLQHQGLNDNMGKNPNYILLAQYLPCQSKNVSSEVFSVPFQLKAFFPAELWSPENGFLIKIQQAFNYNGASRHCYNKQKSLSVPERQPIITGTFLEAFYYIWMIIIFPPVSLLVSGTYQTCQNHFTHSKQQAEQTITKQERKFLNMLHIFSLLGATTVFKQRNQSCHFIRIFCILKFSASGTM